MTIRLVDVHPCDTLSCSCAGVCEITNHGEHMAWHCEDCIAVIELILEETSRMIQLGTPRMVAAEWAAAAVERIT